MPLLSAGVSARAPVLPAASPLPFADLIPVNDEQAFSAIPPWIAARPTLVAAFGCLVLAGLFLLLYVYRQRRYILHWMASWIVLAAALLALSVDYPTRALELSMLGLSRFLDFIAVLLVIVAADTYQRRTWPGRRYLVGLLPLAIWFALAPLALGRRSVLVPGYLIGATALATGALAYANVLRRARLVGAAVIVATLVLLAGTHGWTAWSIGVGDVVQIPFELMVANAVLYLFLALGMHLLVFEDMTYELRVTNRRLTDAQNELHQLAITDPLTGCHNRRFFDEIIHRELQRHERYRIPLSLVFVDIDHFKAVNDSLGHEEGDRLLQYTAFFLRSHVREADYVFRWGGDEFLVLISCSTEAAERKAADLKGSFQRAVRTAQLPAGIGLSVGCSEVIPATDDIMDRVREADQRMYEDKVGAR